MSLDLYRDSCSLLCALVLELAALKAGCDC